MLTVLRTVALFGAVATGFAALGWGQQTATSVGVGGLLATANLYGFARIVAAVLAGSTGTESGAEAEAEHGPRPGRAVGWAVPVLAKMTVLFGGVWLLMAKGWVAPLPLVIGYGTLPLGIALGSMVCDRGGRRPPGRDPGGS